jgi:hypothetical protein
MVIASVMKNNNENNGHDACGGNDAFPRRDTSKDHNDGWEGEI